MPTFIFNDTFQTYPPGNGYPSGFANNGPIFDSTFINTGAQPSPSPAPGFYEKTGIIYFLFGKISFPLNTDLAAYPTNATTIAWSTLSTAGVPGTVQLASIDPVALTGPTLLTFQFEADNSVSLVAPGAPKVNSLVQSFQGTTWDFYSMNVTFGIATVGGTDYITVTANLYLNGLPLMTGAFFQTSVTVASTWNNAPTVNQWSFLGGQPGEYFSEIAATADIETLPFYPNPGSPIHVLTSNVMAEIVNLPPPGNARTSQIAAEFVNLPPPPNARTSQFIVELISKGSQGGGSLDYIKSHQRAAH